MGTKRIVYIIIGVFILLTFMLFPIKEIVFTLFGQTIIVPQSVRHFPFIPESKDSSFEVTTMNRNKDVYSSEYYLYTKENGDYILELRESGFTEENHFQIHYYLISPDGNIKDILKLPNQIYFERGYIVGIGKYCNWTINGDTTIYNAIPIEGKLTKDEFRPYYNKASAVCTFHSGAMLLIEDKWYAAANLDFWISDSDEFEPKGKILCGNDPNRPEYYYSADKSTDYSCPFSEVPQTVGDLEFCFFKKESYSSEQFSARIGSPTGGNSRSEEWSGTGYFQLKFTNSKFCFKHTVNHVSSRIWEYRIPFDIYKTDKFAIINARTGVYLVRP